MTITFDGPTKVITLSSGTITLDVADLYSRWKDFVAAGNAQYLAAFNTVGGETINASAGTEVPLYAFLTNGWRIKPQEANHTLNVVGGVLLVDGGGDPFNNTTGSFVVRINYQQPVQAITVATGGGGGGLTTDQATWLEELHKIHGLKTGSPLSVSTTARAVTGITQSISESAGTVTVSRS